MSVEIKDFVINNEAKLSDNDVVLLNDSTFQYEGKQKYLYPKTTGTIIKLLKNNNIPIIYGCDKNNICYADNRSIDWVSPIIVVTAGMLLQNPTLNSVIINLISNYLYDLFKGKTDTPTIKFNYIYKDSKKCKKVKYEGNIEGLLEIPELIKKVQDSD